MDRHRRQDLKDRVMVYGFLLGVPLLALLGYLALNGLPMAGIVGLVLFAVVGVFLLRLDRLG